LLVTNSPSSSFSTVTGNSPIVVLVTVMVDRRMYPPLRHFFPSIGVAIDLAVIAGDLHFLGDFDVRISDHARAGAHIQDPLQESGPDFNQDRARRHGPKGTSKIGSNGHNAELLESQTLLQMKLVAQGFQLTVPVAR
jgi:hypothetical protein